MSQIDRIWWIDAQIKAGRYPNADQVAKHFEVKRRTAYTDRSFMAERLRAPIATDRARNGWYYTEPTYSLPFLALTHPQSSALRQALLAAQTYLNPTDGAVAHQVYEWLEPYLSGETRPERLLPLNRVAPAVNIDPGVLTACRTAILNRQRLWFKYYGAHRNEVSERTVRPHDICHYGSEPYLIAWCETRKAFRDFFLPRILEHRVLEPEWAFAREPDYDLGEYLGRSLGVRHGEPEVTVRVRFSPYQARWVRERRYHSTQQNQELPDGGLDVTLQVTGIAEAKQWLLGFGAEVTVLEPPELRAAMTEEAKRLLACYDGGYVE